MPAVGDAQLESVSWTQPGRRAAVVGLRYAGIDLAAGALATFSTVALRPGPAAQGDLPPLAVMLALPAMWTIFVVAHRGSGCRCLALSREAIGRVVRALAHLGVLLAVFAYLTGNAPARTFLIVALPLTLVLDLALRGVVTVWTWLRHADAQALRSVLIVGEPCAVAWFAGAVKQDRLSGIDVRGACLVEVDGGEDRRDLVEAGVPCVGDLDSVVDCARRLHVDTVVVVSSSRLASEQLRSIGWRLERTGIDLLVSPGLVDVARRRLRIQTAGSLSLVQVEPPEFRGVRRLLKEVFDRLFALVLLVILLPVLAALWVAIRLSSPGPAIFRQVRIGRDGKAFMMFKFRSMYADAESRLATLQSLNLHKTGPLFKLRDDPRVTPVGRTLRRYSFDELPQLVNVLLGHMSLVGPRPPLPTEVLAYEPNARRRLLVKPGITGLWQVSGRSELDWAESVHLDLRYVENWSPALDLAILWRTASAVIRGTGAY